MKKKMVVVALLGAVLCGSSWSATKGANAFHTKASLVADVASIRPGKSFTVGVLLTMDPGWHTYWKNGGDAGLPTRIRWDLPPGFTAGEIQWPVPEKHLESGDLLTYGYSRETMLLAPITPPTALRTGSTATLKASVHWLECEHLCVPGNADVRLDLPVSQNDPAASHAALFERYRGLVPGPLGASSGVALRTETISDTLRLHLSVEPSRTFSSGVVPDFYPDPPAELTVGRVRAAASPREAVLAVPLHAAQRLTGGVTLRGVIVYQLDNGSPDASEVEIPLPAGFIASFSAPGDSAVGLLDQRFDIAGAQDSGRSLALYLVFGLIGGLLLNIMPCVLPVIALKIFGLVRMAGDHPERVKRMGWSFASGIVASFLILGLVVIVLKFAGQQVGWGFQFQEPLFVVAMSAVVFAFGLSLFGVFELRLPGSAVAGLGNVLAKQSEGGGGYGASFTEGIFATLLATPCTAPFLGTALGFAFAQPPGVILLVFLSVAIGMALPYLVLTARPAWLKYLPAPGGWMVAAKEVMGFLMMATLIWLLYILGRQLGMEAVIWAAAFLLTVGVACWLIGKFATLTASRVQSWSIWGSAAAIVIGGYLLFLAPVIDAGQSVAGAASTVQHQNSAEGIAWKPFSLEGLEADLKENKPVFIDFTADWCLTCKVNEKTVMSVPSVIQKFQQLQVTAVRADWTNRNPDITRLMAKFGRSGVPLYVIFPPGKPNAPIVLPEVITSGIVTEALDRAVAPQTSAD